jgi:hypothetical protein
MYENTIIAVNKGTTPFRYNGMINPNEVNVHVGIGYYGNFILHVMYYY